jgi:hypothetical protein
LHKGRIGEFGSAARRRPFEKLDLLKCPRNLSRQGRFCKRQAGKPSCLNA